MKTKIFALLSVCLLVACGSPEQRASDYLTKAEKYYADGDYVRADLEAKNAAQVNPKNAKARYLLAQIAEQKKEFAQMFGHLLVVVAEEPANVEARLKLGTLLFLGQSWEEAGKQATALLKLAPGDARAHLLQARVLIQKGERVPGLAEVATAVKLDDQNVEAILLQSAADGLKNLDRGIATLDGAINRLPEDKTRPLRELRVLMLAQGVRTEEVEAALESMTRDFPQEGAYQFELAKLYVNQGRLDEAEKLLKKVTEIDPKNADKQLGYVQFLSSQRDPAQAEAALKAFIDQNPEGSKLRLALGQFYEASNRFPEAIKAYTLLGNRVPKSADGLAARNRVAALTIRAGKLDEGRIQVGAILKDAPDDANALLLRSGLSLVQGKYGEAIGDLRLVLRRETKNDKALLLMAQAYLAKKDLALAQDTYRRLLEVVPNSPEGLQQLSMLYIAAKNYPDAEELLRKRLAQQSDDLVASGRLVEVLMAQNLSAKAEEEARRMSALKNQVGVGDFSLGRVLAQKKDFKGSSDAFRRSMGARAGDPLPLDGLVRSLLAEGKAFDAITVLNTQIESKENLLFAKFLLGVIYGGTGEQSKAASYLEAVIKEKPGASAAWVSLASLSKDLEARIGVYERGVKAAPKAIELRLLLASELEVAERYNDALGVYENALQINPKSLPVINNLAAHLLDRRSDQASHARALTLSQVLLTTENPAMLDTLGWAYYRNNQYQAAVSMLERVVAKSAQFPVFHYHLGMAYLKAGNPVGAQQQLILAIGPTAQDYPGLAEARATLKELKKRG